MCIRLKDEKKENNKVYTYFALVTDENGRQKRQYF